MKAKPRRKKEVDSAEDPLFRGKLKALAAHFEQNPADEEDLIQEVLLDILAQERQFAPHSRSWYLRRCLFRMRDAAKRGRSVDSRKRRGNRKYSVSGPGSCDGPHPEGATLSKAEVLSEICADDALCELRRVLAPAEWAVLGSRLRGLSVREACRELRMSQSQFYNCLDKVAAAARNLGIEP